MTEEGRGGNCRRSLNRTAWRFAFGLNLPLPLRPPQISPSMPAAVFFTGGTTGTPKAVPHTHASLLWVADRQLAFTPEPFSEGAGERAGTVCFTPYFHVMGFWCDLHPRFPAT